MTVDSSQDHSRVRERVACATALAGRVVTDGTNRFRSIGLASKKKNKINGNIKCAAHFFSPLMMMS